MKINFENLYDPFNKVSDVNNFNSGNHKSVTDEIYNIYIKKDECFTCDLGIGKNKKPSCISECLFRSHNQTDKITCIVTRSFRHGKSIHMRRGLLIWNYFNNKGFIFRPTNSNGFILHHINQNQFDERPENLIMLTRSFHTSIHSRLENLAKLIGKLNEQNIEKELVDEIKKIEHETRYNIKNDSQVFVLIEKINSLISSKNKLEEVLH